MESTITNDYKVVLLGNKTDLISKRKVSKLEAQKLAEEKGYQYFETSAKTNRNGCVSNAISAFLETATEKLIAKEKEDLTKILLNQKKKIKKLDPEILDKTSCC